ncbi:hypothetical protein VTJ04DRAFT_9356 [Mycothermus thermophilus]|uniref:uncharacterized protein n=1 Tax=Humicola insolens TaxID=85995 RepID=UPI0037435CE4
MMETPAVMDDAGQQMNPPVPLIGDNGKLCAPLVGVRNGGVRSPVHQRPRSNRSDTSQGHQKHKNKGLLLRLFVPTLFIFPPHPPRHRASVSPSNQTAPGNLGLPLSFFASLSLFHCSIFGSFEPGASTCDLRPTYTSSLLFRFFCALNTTQNLTIATVSATNLRNQSPFHSFIRLYEQCSTSKRQQPGLPVLTSFRSLQHLQRHLPIRPF